MMGSTNDVSKTGNRGPEMMVIMWSTTILATLFVVARLCVRQQMVRNFGLDDWLIGLSMVVILSISLSSYNTP